jgi:hypothetical protein
MGDITSTGSGCSSCDRNILLPTVSRSFLSERSRRTPHCVTLRVIQETKKFSTFHIWVYEYVPSC